MAEKTKPPTDPDIVSTDPAPDETGPSLDTVPEQNPPPPEVPVDGEGAEAEQTGQ